MAIESIESNLHTVPTFTIAFAFEESSKGASDAYYVQMRRERYGFQRLGPD